MRLRVRTAVGIVVLAFFLIGPFSSQATTVQQSSVIFEFSQEALVPALETLSPLKPFAFTKVVIASAKANTRNGAKAANGEK